MRHEQGGGWGLEGGAHSPGGLTTIFCGGDVQMLHTATLGKWNSLVSGLG